MKKIFLLLFILSLSIVLIKPVLAGNEETAENTITKSGNINVITVKIGPDGGIIKVEKDCPIKGLVINIPKGAYTTEKTFNISYCEVPVNQYNGKAIPYSPLLIINNGGGYAEEVIKISIPVKLPEGTFAMAGYVNPDTLDVIDMLPPAEAKNDCIISVTRHFQNPIIVTGTNIKNFHK